MTGILRSNRRQGSTLAFVAAISAAALIVLGTFGAHGGVPRTGPLSVQAGLENPPGAVVRGAGLFTGQGARSQLGAAVSGAMIGALSPVAVQPRDGRRVVYNPGHEPTHRGRVLHISDA